MGMDVWACMWAHTHTHATCVGAQGGSSPPIPSNWRLKLGPLDE